MIKVRDPCRFPKKGHFPKLIEQGRCRRKNPIIAVVHGQNLAITLLDRLQMRRIPAHKFVEGEGVNGLYLVRANSPILDSAAIRERLKRFYFF